MKRKQSGEGAKALYDLDGATCPSCAYTIEHLGRKLPGVRDIFVDVSSATVEVDYDKGAQGEVLDAIPEIVRRMGYRAELRSPHEAPAAG